MSPRLPFLLSFAVSVSLLACGDPSDPSDAPDASTDLSDGGVSEESDAGNEPEADAGVEPLGTAQVAPSIDHTCALSTRGELKCFGDGSPYGTLGYEDNVIRGDEPGEMGDNLPVVDLGAGRSVVQVATGGARSCALLDDASVKCWGRNTDGHLGIGSKAYRGDRDGTMGDDLETIDLGTGRSARAIAMGNSHTCAILDNDQIKCWGYNRYGQLGIGTSVDRGAKPEDMGDALPAVNLGSSAKPLALALGGQFSCALLTGGIVKCWGRNDYGQLGIGADDERGDEDGEMETALPALKFGTGRSAIAIAASDQHACAVLDNGAVKCWGDNVSGELGMGPFGGEWGDDPGEDGDAWPAVPLGTGVVAKDIAVGGYHSCAHLSDDSIKCWGYNAYGNFGLGNTDYFSDLSTLGDALPTIDVGTGRTVKHLESGAFYMCVVLDDDSLKCWGRGHRDFTYGGWLGLGAKEHVGDDPAETGDGIPTVELWSE